MTSLNFSGSYILFRSSHYYVGEGYCFFGGLNKVGMLLAFSIESNREEIGGFPF